MSKIKVYSHPRSGTNYLAALLAINLYPGANLQTKPGYVGHWADRAKVPGNPYGRLFGGHGLPRRYKALKPEDCYIYRDGRDVALSLWNSDHFINPDWTKRLTFSEFIRTPLDWVSSPGDKAAPGLTIFQHWKRHLNLWAGSGVQLICYEDLCDEPEAIIADIADKAGLKVKRFKPVTDKVGWFPSRSVRNLSEEDNDYFLKVAGDCYGIY